MTQIRETSSILDIPSRRTLRRKVFVKSYGCQMNVYDSQRMTDVLAPHGYDETSVVEDADLVILNTCHIRERATEKVFSELGKLRMLKAERENVRGGATRVVVAGCVAQAEGAEILRREKSVDIVVGPQSYHRLPALLADADAGRRPIDTEFDSVDKFARLPFPTPHQIHARGSSAFVTIQEGCDKFCSFCVVPYTRGAEVSRPVATIMSDARALARSGVREITLLGQNVNAYHGLDERGRPARLAALCRRLASIDGLDRIRYTTSHPNDFGDDLIAAHAELPALMPFVHLPVQSGSDRILRAMNRKHTVASYVDCLDRLRQARPDIALSSDFIVGFPGETDADFEATLDLIRSVGFAAAFSFKYSPRPGTPAADRPGQVLEDVMKARLASLQMLVEAQRQDFNSACIGRTFGVLLERSGRHAGQLTGKSPYLQQVQVDADASLKGKVVPVKIEALGANSLFGSLSEPHRVGGLEV